MGANEYISLRNVKSRDKKSHETTPRYFFFLQELIDYSHVRKSLDLSGSVMVSLFRPIKLFRGP